MHNNTLSESFGTLSETINGLVKAGYTLDFNFHDECLACYQTNVTLSPEEFQIDKLYRFEGVSNPDDESVVYAISSAKFSVKGILVNGYGTSADEASSKLIAKLKTHEAAQTEAAKTLEIKSNEATILRPEGDRVLSAPLVEMNLPQFIAQIKGEATWMDSDRNAITIYKSDTMRLTLIGLHQNAELTPHKANGVISVQVIEGKMNFITDQKTSVMEKGGMVALQPNIEHSVLALTDVFFLLTLSLNRS